MALEQKLEAVLFYKGESETKTKLAKLLGVTPEEIEEAAVKLGTTLSSRGIRLLRVQDQLELVTAPEASEAVNNVRKEELVRDLGKAGSETLAVVLYRGPVSRADIDYIRGVNCAFILRNLQVRGLVQRISNPNNTRSFLYEATPDLLKHLGVTEITGLPDYQAMREELEKFESEIQKLEQSELVVEQKTNI
ncbi:MAG: Segregation and condensation protein B [Parcubacteria group bacterium GW2011_GWA2_43_11]|nr:MAG: Segregation and condensation protein B [Parcubacteria group bacterium GW2011_GWC2_42_11]KKS86205.1 MAG: Segregation and condensation protein B [Parcubacteria group bacterium GW2011_GWA2_43_11]